MAVLHCTAMRVHARPVARCAMWRAGRGEECMQRVACAAHLRHHLVVGVCSEGDAFQGCHAACQQAHVGRHSKGNLQLRMAINWQAQQDRKSHESKDER